MWCLRGGGWIGACRVQAASDDLQAATDAAGRLDSFNGIGPRCRLLPRLWVCTASPLLTPWTAHLVKCAAHGSARRRPAIRPPIRTLDLAANTQAWNFPFKEPSSSSAGGSSKDGSDGNGHSRHSRRSSSSTGSERSHGQHGGGGGGPPPLALVPLSSQLPLAYRRQLVVTRAAPARIHTQPHHPDDWQYEVAERALRALRPTYASAAVVLLVAAVGGTWHQQAFP